MKNVRILLSISIFALGFLSCNKKGCSDPTADNYVSNVKKARDSKCEYNGEGICGVGIKFCFQLNGVKITSCSAKFFEGSPGSNVKQIIWTNGLSQTNSNYEDIIISIFGKKENSSYSLSNSQNDKTFQAEYYKESLGVALPASSGNLTIKKDNTSDGLIATFNFKTANGFDIKEGNIYKLK